MLRRSLRLGGKTEGKQFTCWKVTSNTKYESLSFMSREASLNEKDPSQLKHGFMVGRKFRTL